MRFGLRWTQGVRPLPRAGDSMATLDFSEGFVDDLAEVSSERVREAVYAVLAPLAALPNYGSPDIPLSVKRKFGSNVRKLVVAPYDIIYTYDEETDVVRVHGLVPQRAVY